ncbi:MAG: hypothetical protein L3J18_00345 [Candidatus Brocadia sp.]|jgi:hypothetical protein|uniref:Glycine-zipper-containing OmpA-like membrane domain-containing protein n=1 Tax=Candidatus Brocadia fulgida TaxID=380242 RepID=A0A0M2UQC7_9BACT|nr:MAG: hypothetical protein BROFUL_03235 [Candidatus Brocadia fulgida]MBV6517593.1 hypothetical protein [Candidatus Brocadia fulgida]UJS20815.1 MAG: hypothetical protein L3J18_00345 [Candidatus Brocadia sp.]
MKMEKARYFFVVLLSALFITSACATKKPVLYPNDYFNKVGRDAADKDVNDCTRLAKEHVGKYGREKRIAEQTAMGAAVGAATGAAAGAVRGNVGMGAATGAAAGAAGGLIFSLFKARDPDPVLKQYIEKCLSEKGYEVIGWK